LGPSKNPALGIFSRGIAGFAARIASHGQDSGLAQRNRLYVGRAKRPLRVDWVGRDDLARWRVRTWVRHL